MAKAKLMKTKKSKFRFDKLAKMMIAFSILAYLLANTAIKSYNVTLAKQRDDMQAQQKSVQQNVATMRIEVTRLENSETVFDIVKEEGIENKQENVVVIPEEK